jgi:hypothetical protein
MIDGQKVALAIFVALLIIGHMALRRLLYGSLDFGSRHANVGFAVLCFLFLFGSLMWDVLFK